MKVLYSDQPLVLDRNLKTMFLCGPTPRSLSVPSWRPRALEILEPIADEWQILVPERIVKAEHIDYDAQVEWEDMGLTNSEAIVFWIPRNLDTMPAFTTNVEFGMYGTCNSAFYGRPDDAPKNRYLDWIYRKYNTKPIYNDLEKLLKAVVSTPTQRDY